MHLKKADQPKVYIGIRFIHVVKIGEKKSERTNFTFTQVVLT